MPPVNGISELNYSWEDAQFSQEEFHMAVPTTPFSKHVLAGYLNWVTENKELTKTHLVCDFRNIDAPDWLTEYVMPDGTIVFNLTAGAIRSYQAGASAITFDATFNRVDCTITVPYGAMVAVYAINSKGQPQTVVNLTDLHSAVTFNQEEIVTKNTSAKVSNLRVVK